MAISTYFLNAHYANLGTVTIYFDDATSQSQNITTIGQFAFDTNGHRLPVRVNWNGQDFYLAKMPLPVQYADATTGAMEFKTRVLRDMGTSAPSMIITICTDGIVFTQMI